MSPPANGPASRGSKRDGNDSAVRRRLELLGEIAETAKGRLDDDVVGRADTLHHSASERLGHGTANTVVALAGATGSGKSSLFNAITGTTFATPGVRRPTTAETLGVVHGSGAEGLLDWLGVHHRRRIETAPALDGLVLLDLPDHDSTEDAHRAEVDRLVQVVDVFIWVVDPQKYADAALHDRYLQRFAGHGAVTIVVLNQIDRLTPAERSACIEDLGRLLRDDGLRGVRVLPASAQTGEGIDALRRELDARTAERRALLRRLDADLDWAASDLQAAIGDRLPTAVPDAARERLIHAATEAAGARAIEAAVEGSYRRRTSLAVGWPPLRWMRTLRPDPLARLGLGTRESRRNQSSDTAITVRRTALRSDPVASAQLGESLRAIERDVCEGLAEGPRHAVERVVAAGGSGLGDALDQAAGTTDLHIDAPRWWRIAAAVQALAGVALAGGLIWLAALFVLEWFKIPEPPLPEVRGWPLPTVLVFVGVVVGVVIALTGRRLGALGARRRARAARAELAHEVTATVDARLITPVETELHTLDELARRIRELGR